MTSMPPAMTPLLATLVRDGDGASLVLVPSVGTTPLGLVRLARAIVPRRVVHSFAYAGVEDDAFPAASDELELRMRHLLEAIAAGDPALAPDLLYPRDAWVRAHDAHDPGKLWDTKVKPYFLKDIQRLHKSQKSMERARFVSFELGHALTHVQPRAHDLKRPVWRVRGSKLTFTIDDKPKRFVIAEMTAFRGAWYVTKLR